MTRIFEQCFTVPLAAIDVHRHVNNVEYLRWMQEVAIAHSTALGWPMERYFEKRCSWVVRTHFIDYMRPARLEDPLRLLTWVSDMNERSSTRKYLFWRESDRQIIARAETVWVFIDTRFGLPRPILEEVRAAFPVLGDDEAVQARLEALSQ